MAEAEHLKILQHGVEAWNRWRQANPDIRPNLRKARLQGRDYRGANFNDANLRRCDISGSDLSQATFRRADLRRAKLSECVIRGADFTSAILIETTLENSILNGCLVYGISAWNVRLKGAEQKGLVVSKKNSPALTVDSMEVAQFIYLLINNRKIRDVIATVGQKAVLILGRFSPAPRKEVLDAIAERLRQMGFLPIVFDFEGSGERDFTETIRILAGLSLFVIADITNPKSAPLELQATVPGYMIPFVPILQSGEEPFAMFKDLTKYDWVLRPIITYAGKQALLDGLEEAVIKPALKKHAELVGRRAEDLKVRSIEDFMNELRAAKDAPPEEAAPGDDADEPDD